MDELSQAEASRRLGYPARTISDAIYGGILDPSTWPVRAGRRVVPLKLLPQIRTALSKNRRKAPQQPVTA